MAHHSAVVGLLLITAACNSLPPAAQERLEVFDTYVDALAERYPFFAQKQIDWAGLAASYRSAVVDAERPSQFYHLLAGLLAELDDPHVSLHVPESCWKRDGAERSSLSDLAGFRTFVAERATYVEAWPEGLAPQAPAHLPAELQSLPRIVRIDGARATPSLRGLLAMGEPGSSAELELEWADGTRTRHVLRRPDAPEASKKTRKATVTWQGKEIEIEFVESSAKLEDVARREDHEGFAVLRIDTFDPDDASVKGPELAAHFDRLLDDAQAAPGLIIDLRRNGGGDLPAMSALLTRLIARPLSLTGSVELETSLFGLIESRMFRTVSFEPRAETLEMPLVVLTSWRTASAAEVFARLLQRAGRAWIVGEQSIGAEAALERVAGPDGTTLSFGAHRHLDRNGAGFQDEGVPPDIAVRLRIEDVREAGSYARAAELWDQWVLSTAVDLLRRQTESR